MAKVIGLGGLFCLCQDVDATRSWYTRVLGIEIDDFGGSSFSHAGAAGVFPKAAQTIWAPFKGESDCFKPSSSDFMMNLMVDDLPGVLKRVKAECVDREVEPMSESYGHFAWIMDPDGRKVELWQPIEPAP
jgi:predicted enzyme related to lactoylglutathione lyase